MMKTFNNTYNSGKITFLITKEKEKYVGVCLEFDLIVTASNPEEAKEKIEDYASLWFRNIVSNKLPVELLNKPAPRKYWNMYERILKEESQKFSKNDFVCTDLTTVTCQYPYNATFGHMFA